MPAIGTALGLPFGRASLWTPKRIPNLAGWWVASDALNSIGPDARASIGQPIRRVPDRSGNGRHFNQTVGTAQPTLQYFNGADASNGVAMNFDGDDDGLLTAAFTHNLRKTIFIVAAVTAGSTLLQFGDNYNSVMGLGAYDTGGVGALVVRGSSGLDYSYQNTSGGTFFRGRGPLVFAIQCGVDHSELLAWRNGSLVAFTSPIGTGPGVNQSGSTVLRLMSRPAGSDWATGKVAEVILYNRHLTSAERIEVSDYLQGGYAL